ncbi:MAG TPA: hypothetical protein VGO47_04670 [Chlamydiales bacterium]|nr:hypothetical protein [Chlamydiales bacterium]
MCCRSISPFFFCTSPSLQQQDTQFAYRYMSVTSDARPLVNNSFEDGDTTLQNPPGHGQLSGRAVDVDVDVRVNLAFCCCSSRIDNVHSKKTHPTTPSDDVPLEKPEPQPSQPTLPRITPPAKSWVTPSAFHPTFFVVNFRSRTRSHCDHGSPSALLHLWSLLPSPSRSPSTSPRQRTVCASTHFYQNVCWYANFIFFPARVR